MHAPNVSRFSDGNYDYINHNHSFGILLLTSLEYPGYLDENLQPCEAVMSRYDALESANKYINDKRNGAILEVCK